MKALILLHAFLGCAAALAIPLPKVVGNPYQDFFGRIYAMPLAAAAYSDNPNGCLQNMKYGGNKKYNMEFFRQRISTCGSHLLFDDDTCSGYTALDHTSKIIIVAFRGTNDPEQLFSEVDDVFEFTPFLGGNVAMYFYNAFISTWNAGIKDDFITLRNKYPSYSVYFVGHSLGGAMASIAAATVVSTNLKKASQVVLLTLGQPRTGDSTYAQAYDALKIESYRIVHAKDAVPHLPGEGIAGYHHHLSEVWYNNDMTPGQTFVVCDTLEEDSTSCSDSEPIYDFVDFTSHKVYFTENLSKYGDNSCVGSTKEIESFHPKALANRNRLPQNPVNI